MQVTDSPFRVTTMPPLIGIYPVGSKETSVKKRRNNDIDFQSAEELQIQAQLYFISPKIKLSVST